MRILQEVIQHFEEEGTLSEWIEKAKVEPWEDLSSEIYNYFIEANDSRDFDIFSSVTHSLFIHGLQGLDWEQLADDLKQNKVA